MLCAFVVYAAHSRTGRYLKAVYLHPPQTLGAAVLSAGLDRLDGGIPDEMIDDFFISRIPIQLPAAPVGLCRHDANK
jgi:acetyl-CoA acetyltransferase